MENAILTEFEDVRISVPWGYLAGRWYGNRKARPILALHGWLDNLGTWNNLLPLLPKHIGVLCMDLPGHGHSSKYPKGIIYHMMDYIDVIIYVMREYNWQKVSLMGHSMGAVLCFIYTSLYPHTVDMVINIDVIKPYYREPNDLLKQYAVNMEMLLLEDDRVDTQVLQDPPSYTYEQLEQMLYKGKHRSVELENCKYILNHTITKSLKYPAKYYLSSDSRVKFYVGINTSSELPLELAKRIRNVPYIIIKATRSNYIDSDSAKLIELLRQNNSQFEMHVIEGTHHVHLNNAKAVAAVLKPFISRCRPAQLDAWSVDEFDLNAKVNTKTSNIVKKGCGWERFKLSKL